MRSSASRCKRITREVHERFRETASADIKTNPQKYVEPSGGQKP